MTETPPPNPGAMLRSKAFVVVLVFAAIIGVVVSLVAWGYLELIYGVQKWVFTELPGEIGFSSQPTWWPLPVLGIAGIIVAVAIVYLPGHGGHLPFKGFQAGATQPIAVPGVALAGFATLALGAVLGPEMPLLAIGGGLAIFAVHQVRKDAPQQMLMVLTAAGGFAALSFVFGSPVIAGVLLVEAAGLGRRQAPLILLPGLTAAGIGALTYTGVKSWTGLSTANYAITPIALPHFGSPTIGDFVWAIAMGIAAAAVTFLIVQLARRAYPLVIRRALIATPVAGLAVAGLAIIFFEWTGKGENNVLFSGQSELGPLVASAAGWSVGALVLLVIVKGLAWSVSMASFRGGPAFPALFIGAAGGIAASHLPGFSLAPAVAVGMAAMFVSMLGLPLSAIVLSAFLTASAGFTGISPLVIVGTVTAFLVTNLLTSLVPADEPAQASGTSPAPAAGDAAGLPDAPAAG